MDGLRKVQAEAEKAAKGHRWLAYAKEAYDQAKGEEDLAKKRALFQKSGQGYQESLACVDREVHKLYKNLSIVHLRLAQCAAEGEDANGLKYHLKEAIEHTGHRARLLADDGSWDLLCRRLASYRILAGVPKCGSMAAVCAAFLFNKAARITDGSSYDELIQASKLGRLKHDISELQVWTKARQYWLKPVSGSPSPARSTTRRLMICPASKTSSSK
ncbi:unnamed protein product [Effrenium voratum]|uniref:Uncharacterized protein n=1 Tax=Effrenium voratum TaxID=2562239 RepID=A0AA36NDM9_9DINO|nr:unnamed protein product [Effrenium voratum]